jgi:hypothetical protein
MDEPLGALDKNLRESMQYEIKHIHESIGVTVVYVTHDQTEALTMSNRIAVFNDGKVQQLSSPDELYERPVNSFVAEFIGENNTFAGEVSDMSGEVSEGFLGFGAGRKKTNFEVAMEGVAAGMALGPLSIAGILAGAPTLLLASAALIGIAKGLRVFKEVVSEADLPALSTNVDYIVSGLADTFARVGEKYPGGGGGIMSALFGSGNDTSAVAQGISAVGGMGRALKGIAKGVQAMANLKFPTGFDKDGNPTGFETINLTTAVPALIANTQLIVTGLSSPCSVLHLLSYIGVHPFS